MSHEHMLFPELADPQPPVRREVIRFTPRPASQRREPSRLDGNGLANRLRRDVERQLAHRRRMLGFLEQQRIVNGE